jgi:hypothetical protein
MWPLSSDETGNLNGMGSNSLRPITITMTMTTTTMMMMMMMQIKN